MPVVLLDTDVVSFLIKGDSRVAAYAPLLRSNRLAFSFMTVAELYQWAGKTIAPQDAWIAATALRHNVPLITHNASDYQNIANLDVRTAAQP